MKDYLNNAEMQQTIVLNTSKNVINHFIESEIMTKAEKSDLKRAGTYITKSLKSMFDRLADSEGRKYVRKFNNSHVVVLNDSELDVLKKRKSCELNAAYEDNKEYIELASITMDLNCKDCTKDWKTCDLCKHFEENEMIPFNEEHNKNNCRYAYSLPVKENIK